jgi:hypothetical protein
VSLPSFFVALLLCFDFPAITQSCSYSSDAYPVVHSGCAPASAFVILRVVTPAILADCYIVSIQLCCYLRSSPSSYFISTFLHDVILCIHLTHCVIHSGCTPSSSSVVYRVLPLFDSTTVTPNPQLSDTHPVVHSRPILRLPPLSFSVLLCRLDSTAALSRSSDAYPAVHSRRVLRLIPPAFSALIPRPDPPFFSPPLLAFFIAASRCIYAHSCRCVFACVFVYLVHFPVLLRASRSFLRSSSAHFYFCSSPLPHGCSQTSIIAALCCFLVRFAVSLYPLVYSLFLRLRRATIFASSSLRCPPRPQSRLVHSDGGFPVN